MAVAQAPPEAAEVLRLAMILFVIPPAVYMLKRSAVRPGMMWIAASFVAVASADLLAVLEDLVPFRPLVDMTQHVSYGVAGALALVAAVVMLRASRATRGRA